MWFWDRMRGSLLSDEVDPTLTELLPRRDPHRDLDALHLSRARVRVDSHLNEASPRGGLRRRMALAGFGGGGMWAAVIGTAAANKAAAAAVGVTLLIGSGTAIEASGIGPAVRDSLGVGAAAEHGLGTGGDTPTGVQGVGPAEDSSAAASVEESDDAPGNLVTVMRDDGTFLVRGLVTDVGRDSLTVDAAGGSPTMFTLAGDATVRLPGPSDEGAQAASVAATLNDLVGNLVLLQGQCDEGAENLHDASCRVTSVTLLGRGGEQLTDLPLGAPDGAGRPDDAGVSGVGVGDAPPQGQPIDTPPVDVPEGAQPETPGAQGSGREPQP